MRMPMRSTMRAILLAAAIFAISYGAAATLGVSDAVLSAGSAEVEGCATSGVTGSPHVAWRQGRYVVAGVTLSGLDVACAGRAVSATLTGHEGTLELATVSGVVPAAGGTLRLDTGDTVDAAEVSGVSMAISG
jgi:hypothetical protein